MSCNSRQQLISAGRTNALQYTYFWKEKLNKITERPKVNVLDLKGVSVSDGKQNSIPYKGILRINAEYDGVITIKYNDNLIDRIKLNASRPIEIDHITWNMEINICIGLDSIWKACFVHETAVDDSIDEMKVLEKLDSYSGKQMPVSHSLGSIALQFIGYPNIRNWLYKCIRRGYINEKAYRYLQSWIISTINKIY